MGFRLSSNLPRPFRYLFPICPGQPRLVPSIEKRLHASIRINRWSMVLHEPTRIGCRTVVAMNLASQHPQHRHQLPAMMGRVRNPPHHDPRTAPRHIEESSMFIPPRVLFFFQSRQPLSAVFHISLNEFDLCFLGGQRRNVHIDSEHVPEPQILTHALMHHLFMHTAPSRIAWSRPDRQILVQEFTPDADYF